MTLDSTAIILIGYQNDIFAEDGILRGVIEEPGITSTVLVNTIKLLTSLNKTPIKIIATPIIFTPDYSELVNPVGILKAIKEAGAFKAGSKGSEIIPDLISFGERISYIPGKRGLNAFSNTQLDEVLKSNGITDVCLAGAITSICIDSTARAAFEKGYKVHIIKDCIAGRTAVEQNFYCDTIFPLYARVIDSNQLFSDNGISNVR